jgi:hypothetical protein
MGEWGAALPERHTAGERGDDLLRQVVVRGARRMFDEM